MIIGIAKLLIASFHPSVLLRLPINLSTIKYNIAATRLTQSKTKPKMICKVAEVKTTNRLPLALLDKYPPILSLMIELGIP